MQRFLQSRFAHMNVLATKSRGVPERRLARGVLKKSHTVKIDTHLRPRDVTVHAVWLIERCIVV